MEQQALFKGKGHKRVDLPRPTCLTVMMITYGDEQSRVKGCVKLRAVHSQFLSALPDKTGCRGSKGVGQNNHNSCSSSHFVLYPAIAMPPYCARDSQVLPMYYRFV